MSVFDVISLLGGLAFFLYGMSLMGSGLKKMAGGRMEEILEKLSSSPVKGLLLGTVVTALIQSSSATTVMVVGFVNSGIMQLRQAIGVIIGANIGTTATGWILTLSGVNGDSLLLSLLKPTTFSPILALIGTILVCFIKNPKKKHLGSILLGFAILMYGMSSMSAAADPLAKSDGFISVITTFSKYPVLGMLVGAALTALIQSVSAGVGILQALSFTGSITYATALPLILGMSIGACMPVMISSIGANKNGRRAALVYLYFNIIGVGLFLALFYVLNAFLHFDFMPAAATSVGIAVCNTAFKIFSAVVEIPFTRGLEKLTVLTVPDGKDSSQKPEDVSELLDERFLSSPGYALAQCKNVVNQMAELDRYNISTAISLIDDFDEESSESITLNEDVIDQYEDKLGGYLLKLSSLSLTDVQSGNVSKLLHSISDFERISDHSVNILDAAKELNEKEISFSGDAVNELEVISNAVEEILRNAITSFQRDDVQLASTVEPLEEVIDLLCTTLRENHIRRLRAGDCTIETGFVFNDIISNFERIADHCSNIAVYVIRMKDEASDFHEYLRDLKSSDNSEYRELYDEYVGKYYDALAE